jgi:hypothetical protein
VGYQGRKPPHLQSARLCPLSGRIEKAQEARPIGDDAKTIERETKQDMTTKEIQMLVGSTQVWKGHNPVCENVKYLFLDWEHDVISVSKSGYVYEYEVKVSYSDFKADAKKRRKAEFYAQAIYCPNYMYYVCPENLIPLQEIPKYAGLMYVVNGELVTIKKAPIIRKTKMDRMKLFEKLFEIMQCRHFLGGTKLTLKNKEAKESRLLREKTLNEKQI